MNDCILNEWWINKQTNGSCLSYNNWLLKQMSFISQGENQLQINAKRIVLIY